MKRLISFALVLLFLTAAFLTFSRTAQPATAALSICPGASFMLTGDQEVPPVIPAGTGSAMIGYNITTHTISWNITYSGLQGEATGAHIHRGLPGEIGSVEVNIGSASGLSSPMTGSAVLTTSQEADLLEGKLYINIHSTVNPDGEVRGQIPVPAYQLSGAQEVPANASTADGSAIVFFDLATKTLSWNVSYSGLLGTVTGAHFHNAPAGENGPVIINIGAISGLTSPMIGSATLTNAQVYALKTSNLYVNIHSTVYPDGEIRSQIDGCSLPNVLRLPLVQN